MSDIDPLFVILALIVMAGLAGHLQAKHDIKKGRSNAASEANTRSERKL